MGPRSAALISGHTEYHRRLETLLAELHRKEACVITPTGFAANTALFAALGAVASINAASARPTTLEKIAVFSDALNHASIIDGLQMMERHRQAVVSVYRHNDMQHLDLLLTNCASEKKVVVTDSLFSMEGDFAPMLELVELRKKHGFLLVVDEAHTTLVCGKTGGGVGELYDIQDHLDIIVGTLSKATGCLGGYIACSDKFGNLVRGFGRPNMFTTATPLPVVAACYAAVTVARKEGWRRQAVWRKVQDFAAMTKHPASSPILSLVVGSEATALRASEHMLKRGFLVTAIRPPAVASDACR
ncbi:8-amino-7-oxononanoate synthase-like [Wolffia australiana]